MTYMFRECGIRQMLAKKRERFSQRRILLLHSYYLHAGGCFTNQIFPIYDNRYLIPKQTLHVFLRVLTQVQKSCTMTSKACVCFNQQIMHQALLIDASLFVAYH